MIQTILNQWTDEIAALPFIERYGGLVRPMRVQMPSSGGTIEKTFPVSCSVSASNCFESGKYRDLVPDDRYKSVAYWEDLSGLSFLPGRRAGTLRATATVRFVCWVNLKAVGIDSCDGLEALVMNAIGLTESKTNIDDPVRIASITMKPVGIESKDLRVFQSYSYDDLDKMFYFPYDFFAIRYEISFLISKDCLPTIEINPIECITL